MTTAMLSNLPSIAKAKLPAVYQDAREALALCFRLDECKGWADKAAALASYAKQADDRGLEKLASRIRARAIRRCGELLRQLKRPQGDRRHERAVRVDVTPRYQTLTRICSPTLSSQCEHDDILALPFAPFSEVFRRCAVVVHHGGMGTAARALQAGVPMLVIPWGYDQFNTAMMMVDAGVACTVTARRCSVRSVTSALRRLQDDSGHRAAATEMARVISREDGVEHLVQSIEELLPPRPLQ